MERRPANDNVVVVTDRYFGELSSIPVGRQWHSRRAVSADKVHRPTIAGISGTKADGADSIVVSGGYEDDEDFGDVIIYTGAGGNDPSTGKQTSDQEIDHPGNAALVTSQNQGLPVRVIRGAGGDPAYSPAEGYRYDGLFRVVDHWGEIGRSGYRVWRFKLARLSLQEATPYVTETNLPEGTSMPKTSTGVVTRVVRSTAVSRAIKKLYRDRCQVCNIRLEVPGGSVSEGAHIRALGSPHNGPDTPENVLCLCPNHHTLFDQGGIFITADLKVVHHDGQVVGSLNKHAKHAVGLDYLSYHRGLWGY